MLDIVKREHFRVERAVVVNFDNRAAALSMAFVDALICKIIDAHTVVDGFYAGVADYSPFVLHDLPIAFGGLRSSIETFSTEVPVLSIVDLSASALSVMNGQLMTDAAGYSDYVAQAVLNAMNVIRLKNDASVDMSNGVRDWEWIEG